MEWVPIAIVTALSTATTDAILKGRFSHLSASAMAIIRSVSAVPLLLPFLMVMTWPELGRDFWLTLAMLLPLEVFALVLYMKALKSSPLSLSVPFLAFTPAFITLSGWLILNEKVSVGGFCGVFLTCVGAYTLNIKKGRKGILLPIKAIGQEPGSRLMLTVAAIYSITSVLGKKAIGYSSPFFFACFYFTILGIFTPLVMLFSGLGRDKPLQKGPWTSLVSRQLGGRWTALWAVGLFQAIMVLTHMWAINMATAAYMIAVKRLSLIFSVLYGYFLFGDREIVQRLAGSGLMVLGVFLIVLSG